MVALRFNSCLRTQGVIFETVGYSFHTLVERHHYQVSFDPESYPANGVNGIRMVFNLFTSATFPFDCMYPHSPVHLLSLYPLWYLLSPYVHFGRPIYTYFRINKEKHEKKQLRSKIEVSSIVLQKEIVYFSEVTRWFPNGTLLLDMGVGLDVWTTFTCTRFGKPPAMHVVGKSSTSAA